MTASVSSGTRSKNVSLFGCLSLGGSSKSRKNVKNDMGLDSVSAGSKRMRFKEKPFVTMDGVSSRTRSKNVRLFDCLSLDSSSKLRKNVEADKGLDSVSVSGSKRMRVKEAPFGMIDCVSSRTRSKNVPLFGCLSPDGSSLKRRKIDEDDMGLESVSGSKERKVNEDVEGLEQCDEKKYEGDGEKEVKSDENGEIDAKDENFNEEKCDLEHENPITVSVGGVSSRTRSKSVPLFGCLSLDVLSSKRRKSDEDGIVLGSVCGSRKMRVRGEVLVVPENDKVISIHDDDVDDEEGLEQCGEKMFEDGVDVIKEVKSDESGGNGEIAGKDENFVDENYSDESDESDDEELSVDDDGKDDDDDDVEGSEQCDEKMFEGCVDVEKELKIGESGEICEIADKDGYFVDEKCDLETEKPITISVGGVSSRTRSKTIPLFGCLSLDGLSSTRRKSDEDEMVLGSVTGSRKTRVKGEAFVDLENDEVIPIHDDDVDDEDEEGLEEFGEKMFEGGVDVIKEVKCDESGGSGEIADKDENFVVEKFSDESGESDDEELVDVDSDDDDDDAKEEEEDESEENETSDEDFRVDEDEDESSPYVNDDDGGKDDDDDDGKVEEGEEGLEKLWQECAMMEELSKDNKSGISEKNNEEVWIESSAFSVNNDGSKHAYHSSVTTSVTFEKKGYLMKSSSNLNKVSEKSKSKRVNIINMQNVSDEDDIQVIADHPKSFGSSKLHKGDTNNVEEEEEEKVWRKYDVVEEDEDEGMKKLWQEYDSVLEEVKDKKNGISEMNTENKTSKKRKSKSVDIEWYVCDDVQVIADHPKSFCSSKLHKGERNNAKAKAKDYVKANDIVNVDDYDEGKEVKGLGVGGVSLFQAKQEKMRFSDTQKMPENKGRDYRGRVNIWNGEKKATMENNGLNRRVNSTLFMRKELHLAKLLAECYWGDKNDTTKNDSIQLEIKDVADAVDRRDSRPPPVCVETPSLIWSLKKVEKVEKTKEEEEQEMLWDQVDTSLREIEAESMIGSLGTNEVKQENMGNPSTLCEHDTRLDDEIGVYCRWCGVVITEIKYISPLVVDRFPYEGSGKRTSFDDSVNASLYDGSQFNVSDEESVPNFSYNEGTVWDLIPGVKQTLYPHQQEGFEFIWKNMAGNIHLHKLKNANPRKEGGCIISHAPGTGKTRLTIVFLMAYMKVFPKCLPVIVAPAGLLLTWEDEFKKWDIGVPFHNLNSSELSGKEHNDAINLSHTRQSKGEIRMAKLISWFKEKSILGISYALYKILAFGGGESKDKKKKKHTQEKKQVDVEKRKENDVMRKVLLEVPGLLILDEGHTPRNRRSNIWKVLSEVQARKRIILSGTPFQNSLLELYNTFSLVKPSFPNTIPSELKKFCERKSKSKEWSWEADSGNSTTGNSSDDKIMQLKLIMDPFVHVHKGAILQKKLPGLRDCVLILKPDSLQKQIIESIQSDQNTLIFERKQTVASVHPSLFLQCKLLEEEESVVDKDRLEKQWLNLYGGVKTKFLLEFVKLCDANNEKVLVFSQFLDTLSLIEDQLNSVFKWTKGKEILYLDGNVDPNEKQSRIHSFNDASSQAKIMLASTRACSEGISLVGASRVVLLDVVWNPSVEQQAISRAYRIGQKRVVYTYHLLTQGTAEYTKYCKQAHKDRLSELVFTAKNTNNDDESKSCAGNIEDRILDQMMRHEKLKDMFVKCVVQPKEQDLVDSFAY
ncbi:SNF2 domain-containing protein CLASSY 4-like [Trifolium pratense]|uniref:SNF2 domain-containing protein CLASSY 4-like n=1 Tax=Trifolium pratense TaxID=57577 RepID=UPI001E693A9A|nr:SNF2 domain-containing protein CLASSY 4-like [Trifolium pratense]